MEAVCFLSPVFTFRFRVPAVPRFRHFGFPRVPGAEGPAFPGFRDSGGFEIPGEQGVPKTRLPGFRESGAIAAVPEGVRGKARTREGGIRERRNGNLQRYVKSGYRGGRRRGFRIEAIQVAKTAYGGQGCGEEPVRVPWVAGLLDCGNRRRVDGERAFRSQVSWRIFLCAVSPLAYLLRRCTGNGKGFRALKRLFFREGGVSCRRAFSCRICFPSYLCKMRPRGRAGKGFPKRVSRSADKEKPFGTGSGRVFPAFGNMDWKLS